MREKFTEIYTARIKREGSEKLLKWLSGTDRPGQHPLSPCL